MKITERDNPFAKKKRTHVRDNTMKNSPTESPHIMRQRKQLHYNNLFIMKNIRQMGMASGNKNRRKCITRNQVSLNRQQISDIHGSSANLSGYSTLDAILTSCSAKEEEICRLPKLIGYMNEKYKTEGKRHV